MKKHHWTEQDEQFLRDHYNRGKGLYFCADSLGINPNAVKKKAARLGVAGERRNFTEDEITFIKDNYAELGLTKTSEILGVKRCSVNTLITKVLHLRMNKEARGRLQAVGNTKWERTQETKDKISKKAKERLKVRENHPMWKGGVTALRLVVRPFLSESWIMPILKRDRYTCQECGKSHSGAMNVHHLVPYAMIQKTAILNNPEYSLDDYEGKVELAKIITGMHRLDMGITLCVQCHKNRHYAKRGELRGSLTMKDEGNPQPSWSNVSSFVGQKVQRLTGEDSRTNNPDTSAPDTYFAGVMR